MEEFYAATNGGILVAAKYLTYNRELVRKSSYVPYITSEQFSSSSIIATVIETVYSEE